jgi:hypothetical protein
MLNIKNTRGRQGRTGLGAYLKDRFNYKYLILRFGYPSHLLVLVIANKKAGHGPCLIPNNTHHLQVLLVQLARPLI